MTGTGGMIREIGGGVDNQNLPTKDFPRAQFAYKQ